MCIVILRAIPKKKKNPQKQLKINKGINTAYQEISIQNTKECRKEGTEEQKSHGTCREQIAKWQM